MSAHTDQERRSRKLPTGRAAWLFALMAVGLLALAACAPLPAAPVDESAGAAATEPAAEATAPAAEEMATAEATAPAQEEAAAPEATTPAEEEASMGGDPEAGAYVFAMVSGCGCHFNRDAGALAGGNKFEGDFGVVYAANITPDPVTGIGSASDQQIADAIRIGHGIDDRNLLIMPQFSALADADAYDLIAYLRAQEPVENAIPARELAFDPPAAEIGQAPPATAPTEGADRGRYIATLTRCGMCHTPKNDDGSLNWDMPLAGAPFRDTVAPNLTPDELTGLGAWSEEEIAAFLATGIYDDGTESHPGMKGVVDRGLGKLTDADRLAIVAFLKSLPAIENLPQAQ